MDQQNIQYKGYKRYSSNKQIIILNEILVINQRKQKELKQETLFKTQCQLDFNLQEYILISIRPRIKYST